MILRSSLYINLFSFLFIISTYAADVWCIEDRENPPCYGFPGRCTRNSDGSPGGFIADTATVESEMVSGLSHNRPHIGLEASVCDRAHVTDHAHVADHALITGDAWIYGDAQVFGNARVSGGDVISAGDYAF